MDDCSAFYILRGLEDTPNILIKVRRNFNIFEIDASSLEAEGGVQTRIRRLSCSRTGVTTIEDDGLSRSWLINSEDKSLTNYIITLLACKVRK